MKKKFVFAALSLVTAGIVTFTSYKTLYQDENIVESILGENVEALTRGESGRGFYQRSSGKCGLPCEYKTWVSCRSGGKYECQPSDCC
jgi:hypothetical protein